MFNQTHILLFLFFWLWKGSKKDNTNILKNFWKIKWDDKLLLCTVRDTYVAHSSCHRWVFHFSLWIDSRKFSVVCFPCLYPHVNSANITYLHCHTQPYASVRKHSKSTVNNMFPRNVRGQWRQLLSEKMVQLQPKNEYLCTTNNRETAFTLCSWKQTRCAAQSVGNLMKFSLPQKGCFLYLQIQLGNKSGLWEEALLLSGSEDKSATVESSTMDARKLCLSTLIKIEVSFASTAHFESTFSN